jgi:hypothetical protein
MQIPNSNRSGARPRLLRTYQQLVPLVLAVFSATQFPSERSAPLTPAVENVGVTKRLSVRWARPFGVESKLHWQDGAIASGRTVFVQTALPSEITAFDASTGAELWRRHDTFSMDATNEALIVADATTAYVGGDDGSVEAIGARQGAVRWRSRPCSTPAFVRAVTAAAIVVNCGIPNSAPLQADMTRLVLINRVAGAVLGRISGDFGFFEGASLLGGRYLQYSAPLDPKFDNNAIVDLRAAGGPRKLSLQTGEFNVLSYSHGTFYLEYTDVWDRTQTYTPSILYAVDGSGRTLWQRTYRPDADLHVRQRYGTDSIAQAQIDGNWYDLFLFGSIYRYVLNVPPAQQRPLRADGIAPLLRASGRALVLSGDAQRPALIDLEQNVPIVRYIAGTFRKYWIGGEGLKPQIAGLVRSDGTICIVSPEDGEVFDTDLRFDPESRYELLRAGNAIVVVQDNRIYGLH